jgi:uncharacterized Zn-binding protein involved in type VI secretion
MGKPAAKQGDKVVAVDTHIVMVPTPAGPVPTPLPHAFSGALDGGLSADVRIEGKAAATVDSTSANSPAHLPTPPGSAFQSPPGNRGTVTAGSAGVKINGKAAARAGDTVKTCNDPSDADVGAIVPAGAGTVRIG